jgi:hypothetical protein
MPDAGPRVAFDIFFVEGVSLYNNTNEAGRVCIDRCKKQELALELLWLIFLDGIKRRPSLVDTLCKYWVFVLTHNV